MKTNDLDEKTVEKWIAENPEKFQKILVSRAKRPADLRDNKLFSSSQHNLASPEMQQTLFDVAKMLNSTLDLKSIVRKVLHVSVNLIKVERSSLFLADKEKKELYDIAFDLQSKSDGATGESHVRIPFGVGVAGNVALTGIGKHVKDAYQDPMFNKEIDLLTGFKTINMLVFPVFATLDNTETPELMGVASLINKKSSTGKNEFTENDIEIFQNLLNLVGAAIKNAKMYEQSMQMAKANELLFQQSKKESDKSKILLEVAKLTSSASGTESLIQNILGCAKKYVKAEVCSLFLIDSKRKELYSSVFNGGNQEKIRFPMTAGVAGFVATTGKTANIKNAYDDPRFNPSFDKQNNFRTVSMISVPIFGPEGFIVGVANLINKFDQHNNVVTFSEEDQELFEGIAVFCGLAIHKTLLIEETQAQKQRLEIVMELISYHNRPKPEEILLFNEKRKEFKEAEDLALWKYDPHKFLNTDENLAIVAYQMILNLKYNETYEIPDPKLVEYILTVRRNYRPVAYHNFTHAVSVTHGLFFLIFNGTLDPYFSKLDLFAMLIAALNHDIDHRGTNNAFQQKTHSVLASFYATSTMERHHINHCLMVLNSNDGIINILENLSNQDYKKALDVIEASILATDLALFFGTKKKIDELRQGNGFNKSNLEHISYLRGVVMTCSDLCAMYSPFENARKTADCVYEEFFQQGDEEAKAGIPYTSELTDRSKAGEIPRMQVGFYNFVVIPAFENLHYLLGKPVEDLLEGCKSNKYLWENLKNSGEKYDHQYPPHH